MKHRHVIRFQNVYCTKDGLFDHYHNTEFYLHMNIPAVNSGMLMIIQTYDSDRFNP